MKKIKALIKKLSYKKKVFAGMILTSVIPLIICFGGVLLSFKGFNEKKLQDDAEIVLNSAQTKILSEGESIEAAITSVAHAPATLRMLEDNEKDDVFSVYRMLYSSVTAVNRYADFAIYDINGELKLYTGDRENIKDSLSVSWGILYELINEPSKLRVRGGRNYYGTTKETVLRFGRAVVDDDGRVKGFVIAEIRDTGFFSLLRSVLNDNTGALLVLDDFDETVYKTSDVDGTEFVNAKEALYKNHSEYYLSADSFSRYYMADCEKYSLHIFYRQQVEPYAFMSQNLVWILVLASVVGMTVSLLVSHQFSRMFYKPIHRMSEGMKEIKKGNFAVEIEVDSEDELGRLSKVFNEMSAELTDNMNELVKREKELADANIKMMQAQLNPHFIYNTLETMKWIGKDNEVPEVATLSSGLADIMRASISSGRTVSLKKEIDLVESYAAIQQIRFSDKFELITDISEELMECEVPKLILQPVVENAILHGFSTRNYGQVLISGFREDDRLILIVKDDGVGVDAETMYKLNNHEQLAKGTNIGFHNVDAIIRLHYGEEYGLLISAGENGGTEVKYTLPYIVAVKDS